jgi:Xaa-Pro aminopeptidase
MPDVEQRLDTLLHERDLEAFLQFDDATNRNQLYVSGFEADDAFTFLRYDNKSTLLVAPLEKGRAESESTADTVLSTAQYVSGDVRGDSDAEIDVIHQFLADQDIERVGVPRDFPLHFAEQLGEEDIHVESVPDVIVEARKRKRPAEIAELDAAQAATEQAMSEAERLLQESTVRDGKLHHNEEVLTAERLRAHIRRFLMDESCRLDEAIVACGSQAADPHDIGSGPLEADEPILLDIYPQHGSGYWGDMSRTFVRGTPDPELKQMYETTLEAFDAALDALEEGAGTIGGAVHGAACDVFETAGYPTIRDGDIDEGFLHSTGHAVGLDLHEEPRLVSGAEELDEGYTLTIEPGLYDPDVGGVRVEDMIVVTEDGYRNLNDYHTDLVI